MSDLISKGEVESVLHNNLHALIDTDQLYQLYKDINRLPTYSIPSTDIMECARAIKEYCRDRDNLDEPCEDCAFHFYMGYKGHCRFKSFPSEWNLPEGEKE